MSDDFPDASHSQAHDAWMRRKQSELHQLMPLIEEAATDRAAGRLTDAEREWLDAIEKERGEPLTDGNANWSLAQFRHFREW